MRLLLPGLVAAGLALSLSPARASDVSTTIPIVDRADVLIPSPGCEATSALAVARLPQRCFIALPSRGTLGTPTFFTPLTQWLRFEVPELAGSRTPWQMLVSTYVTAGELSMIDGGRIVSQLTFGSTVPVADRPVYSHDIRVPLPVPVPPHATYVVRLTSPYSMPDPLQLQPAAVLDAADIDTLRNTDLAFAFLNGGALTMALFNLVLFALLRRSVYLYYATAISAMVFYQLVGMGPAWTLLWPHLGLRDDYPSYVVWVVYFALVVQFTRKILNLPTVAPLMDRILFAVFALLVIDSIAYVLIPDALVKLGLFAWVDPLVTLLMVGVLVIAGAVALRRRVPGALAYIVAFGGSSIGIVLADAAFYLPAFSETPSLAYLPTSYGVLWEAIFLALALGQRMRQTELDAARLSEFAFRDGLTGIANRRAFDNGIQEEWNRMQRVSGTIAVVMFDIDHFKSFNDRYGHPAGDERLIAVARAIAQAARRQGDLAARYGGEEFALLLPNTSLEAAFSIAEGIRQRVATEASDVELTLSAGVAVATATGDVANTRSLLSAADAALYSAKTGGRNRTVRWNTLLGGSVARAGGG